jgi:hypothetical protein
MTTDAHTNDQHRTPDLYRAAYLIAAGAEIEKFDREKSRFFFTLRAPDVGELVDAYPRGIAIVNALAFANAIKSLKAAIHTTNAGAA